MKLSLLASISIFLCCFSCFAQSDRTPKENWCIQKVTDQDNNAVFITANLGYKDYAYKAEFPWYLEINMTTVNKYPNGHPTKEEAPILDATEDLITAELRKAGAVQFVGRTTVKGYRELYYFVTDPEKANAVLARMSKKRQPRAWEYRMQEDKQWERVAPFFSGIPKCL